MKTVIRMIMIFCAVTLNLVLSGCGSGGGGGVQSYGVTFPAASNSGSNVSPESVGNYYSISTDELGLLKADVLATESDNVGGFVLRAADSAKMVQGSNAGDVFRIDITNPGQVSTGIYYNLGANATSPAFPGNMIFPNGENSTTLVTDHGTIEFTSFGTHNGDVVAGSFDVHLKDLLNATKQYHIAGAFHFVLKY